jgi:hypothetical protein
MNQKDLSDKLHFWAGAIRRNNPIVAEQAQHVAWLLTEAADLLRCPECHTLNANHHGQHCRWVSSIE